jgi:cation diffusion facilitator CzcD-associated flavoprotein CzcO
MCREQPQLMKQHMVSRVVEYLGQSFAPHFTPSYNPWDQRVCLLPNGDLVQALKENRASVVTDVIADFTQDGIVLGSGRTLQADVIVAATGLQLNQLGDVAFSIGGSSINFAETIMWLPPPNLNTLHLRTNSAAVAQVQGHDVLWRAQSGCVFRIRERVMDAEGGFDVRVFVPRHQSHARARPKHGDAHAAAARR